MDDKTILEGILWDLKVLSDLCLHGSIESGTKKVHTTFINALNEFLTMQNDLYNLMSENNMYSVTKVAESKIAKTLDKQKESLKEE